MHADEESHSGGGTSEKARNTLLPGTIVSLNTLRVVDESPPRRPDFESGSYALATATHIYVIHTPLCSRQCALDVGFRLYRCRQRKCLRNRRLLHLQPEPHTWSTGE